MTLTNTENTANNITPNNSTYSDSIILDFIAAIVNNTIESINIVMLMISTIIKSPYESQPMNPANKPAKKPINRIIIYITRFSSVMANCSIRIEALL